MLLILLFLLGSLLIRYLRFEEIENVSFKQWDNLFRKQVFTRLDSIMFGLLGAWFFYYFKNFWVRNKKAFLVLGILFMALHKSLIYFRLDLGFTYNVYYCVWSFSLISLATLLFIPFLSEIKTGSGKIFRNISRISLISYSMYLVNLTLVQELILRALYKIWPLNYSQFTSLVYFALAWIFTILISILLYKYFEVPTTKLREKWAAKDS